MGPVFPSLLLALATIAGQLSFSSASVAADPERSALGVSPLDVVPMSPELAVYPAPGSWTNDPWVIVLVKVLNGSFSPELGLSELTVDRAPLILEWNPQNRTLWAAPELPLNDGEHDVALVLRDATLDALSAEWSFGVDTVPPWVSLDPLPGLTDLRVFTVNGTVVEDHLKVLDVNGFHAAVNGERFFVPILLWPGRNDLLLTAVDEANNRGLAVARIHWFPSPRFNESYLPFLHTNASFTTRFPSAWEVEVDQELDPGFRADVVAAEPATARLRATIAVVSRPTGEGMNEAFLLSIMEDFFLRLSGESRVDIVSRPERIELVPPTVAAAQLSYLETLPEGLGVFRLVTGFWSPSVHRLWIIIGSIAAEEVAEKWPAVQTAVEAFRTVEPLPPVISGGRLPESVGYAFAVTIAAIVFIVTLFGAVLYSVHQRRRRTAPPRQVP